MIVFTVCWNKGFGYFQSPVGLITKVVRRAEKTGARGVLVTLDWPGSVFLLKVEEKVQERDCVVEEEVLSQNDLP